MEQGMKCIWLQWRSDGQAIPPSVIQSIDPWLCYLHQTSHLWTSERAWFLTHIIGNEMLTYLKLYAFWYDTASSYWDTPVVYIIAGLYIIHTILITFLSCMQSLMRITPLLEKWCSSTIGRGIFVIHALLKETNATEQRMIKVSNWKWHLFQKRSNFFSFSNVSKIATLILAHYQDLFQAKNHPTIALIQSTMTMCT